LTLYSIWATSIPPILPPLRSSTYELQPSDEKESPGGGSCLSDDLVFGCPASAAGAAGSKSKRSSDFRQQALKEFKEAVVHFPSDPLLACCLAQLCASSGDHNSAKMVLERLGQHARDEADAHTLLALWTESTSQRPTESKPMRKSRAREAAREAEREETLKRAQLFELYSSIMRCDVTSEMALEGLVQLHQSKGVCTCEGTEVGSIREANCTCLHDEPCTTSFLAASLADHLDVCPWNVNAWKVLSEVLPKLALTDVARVAAHRQWWIRSHFCLDPGSPLQDLAAELACAQHVPRSRCAQSLSEPAQRRHRKGKEPAGCAPAAEDNRYLQRQQDRTRLHLQYRRKCIPYIVQDAHARAHAVSGITRLLSEPADVCTTD